MVRSLADRTFQLRFFIVDFNVSFDEELGDEEMACVPPEDEAELVANTENSTLLEDEENATLPGGAAQALSSLNGVRQPKKFRCSFCAFPFLCSADTDYPPSRYFVEFPFKIIIPAPLFNALVFP